MALPKNTTIPQSSQFTKLQIGKNKFRILSDIRIGWEGWKNNKPFRHEGSECKIKDSQVDLNQNGKPNINYFWVMAVWNYQANLVQVLQLKQKTLMSPLYALEENEDWGDLKNYDIEITKALNGDKTSYTVLGIPPKPLSNEIKEAYAEAKVDLDKLFAGEYPMPSTKDEKTVDLTQDTPF
jgi:hypothetical protein